jgi:hypothetical protein
MTTSTGTWYPPRFGTGGFLHEGQLFTNPPFKMTDPVNHPPHYTAGPVEVIDILEQAASVAPNPVLGGLQWQCLKYLLRLWLKGNSLQDAQKAQWYLNRLICKLEVER